MDNVTNFTVFVFLKSFLSFKVLNSSCMKPKINEINIQLVQSRKQIGPILFSLHGMYFSKLMSVKMLFYKSGFI